MLVRGAYRAATGARAYLEERLFRGIFLSPFGPANFDHLEHPEDLEFDHRTLIGRLLWLRSLQIRREIRVTNRQEA